MFPSGYFEKFTRLNRKKIALVYYKQNQKQSVENYFLSTILYNPIPVEVYSQMNSYFLYILNFFPNVLLKHTKLGKFNKIRKLTKVQLLKITSIRELKWICLTPRIPFHCLQIIFTKSHVHT